MRAVRAGSWLAACLALFTYASPTQAQTQAAQNPATSGMDSGRQAGLTGQQSQTAAQVSGAIRGAVSSKSGSAVVGATVTLERGGSARQQATSDENGDFSFTGVAIGAFQLTVSAPRFQFFNELPEHRYEAFLSVPILCRGRLVGVINLQHRQTHSHTRREIRLLSSIGFFVGAEIEMARLEEKSLQLSDELESRKVVERAKGILQRELQVSEEEAYLSLRRQSRQLRKTMKEVAQSIIREQTERFPKRFLA